MVVTLEFWLFVILASWIGSAALAVVLTKSLLQAALSLWLALLGVALLFFLLGQEFLGAVQLMVYVGGTMVLLIYGGMISPQGITSRSLKPIGLLLAGHVAVAMFLLLVGAARGLSPGEPQPAASVESLGFHFLGAGPSLLLPFELASVHLLVVLIAAAGLARTAQRAVSPSAPAVPVRTKEGPP